MSITNFKTATEIKLQIELEKWQNGEIQWCMNNQHDQYVIESALGNIESMPDDKWEWWIGALHSSIMDIAHDLSSFDAPEIDSAWID